MPIFDVLKNRGYRISIGPPPTTQQYLLSSWLFVRVIALIYFAAFISLSVQITGLVGSDGILPVQAFLDNVKNNWGWLAWVRLPTLFWVDASDPVLQLACFTGAFFAVLLFLGRLQLLSSIALFVLYLSVFRAGQLFLNFQWDYLLLEAGFLTILLVQGNHKVVIFLFHLLLFRLRFLSGFSKLSDPSWSGLTTLTHYFETQPLPHIGAWYFHQLPEWLLRIGTGFTLFVELLVPLFIFLPRPFRLFAAFSTILLQLMIIASSNHNWINLLTIALCLFLLDDRLMAGFTPKVMAERVRTLKEKYKGPPKRLVYAVLVIIASTSIATTAQVFVSMKIPAAFNWIRGYGIGNAYHVFPSMQTERYEFQIEGSYDGEHWQAYEFKYKPDNEQDIPAFIVPHQPRLDWMVWFVPTKNHSQKYWFERFLWGLKNNQQSITALLDKNPFVDKAPAYLRVQTYRYRFNSADEFDRTGNYWQSEYLGTFPFVPPRIP